MLDRPSPRLGLTVRSFGSEHHLLPSPPLPPLSSSSLHLQTLPRPQNAARRPPLSDAIFSSSTSDLEKLKRNRILPALSRHRNREHLHLSDDGLDLLDAHKNMPESSSNRLQAESAEKPAKKARSRCSFCHKRLSIATVHTCRCGAEFCPPHRYAEVHGCSHDYKAQPPNFPIVSAPKLPKI